MAVRATRFERGVAMSRHYDVEAVRKEFPAAERMVYLDSGFQAPLARPVMAAIETFLREGLETAGPKSVWLDRVEQTRAKLARFLGVSADEIAFTKNTSESMNIAANALPLRAGDSVLMIHGDHPNNTYAFLNLKKKGVRIDFLPMTDVVDAEAFLPYIDDTTRAISLSHVTFHAGHRFDIESIGALCADKKFYFVVDVMQAIGVVPIDVKAVQATFVGCGSHKGLLVPQGLGLLYWDQTLKELEPAYLAAASLAEIPDDLIARPDRLASSPTARRFELGNFNLPAIHALGASLDMIEQIGVKNIQNHCFDLGDHLLAQLDNLGVSLIGPRQRRHRSPHIYVVGLPATEWLSYFEGNGVRVSPERDGIRISFGMFNTIDDVDRLVHLIRERLSKNSFKAA
ncbi:aminotransferase [Bradyrhizobium brasilense]|nr:aminotransferase [Bradyrhizobium brasilense]